jgi:hypothetical protein
MREDALQQATGKSRLILAERRAHRPEPVVPDPSSPPPVVDPPAVPPDPLHPPAPPVQDPLGPQPEKPRLRPGRTLFFWI